MYTNKNALSLTLLFLLLTPFTSFAQSPEDDTPPSLIIELFRHGSRGPNDPNWDPSWLPIQCNELTAVGMREHYILGKAIRMDLAQRFGDDFLVSQYESDKIFVRSTDVNRTIMSAESHLYGMFEADGFPNSAFIDSNATYPFFNDPATITKISQQLKGSPALPSAYLPIPIHMEDHNDDITLATIDNCINYGFWKSENLANSLYPLMLSRFQNTLDELNSLGYNLSNWSLLNDFADTVIVDHTEGRPLPGNLQWDSLLIQNLTFLYNWGSVYTEFGHPEQRQYFGIPILTYMQDFIEASLNGTSNLQIVLLSGHDDTLLTFLNPLGVVTPDCIYMNFMASLRNESAPYPNCRYPTFASNIIIEVYNTDNPYLRIYYGGNEIFLCNNGESVCTYPQFANLVSDVTKHGDVNTFNTMCNNPFQSNLVHGMESTPANRLQFSEATIILGCICFVLSVFAAWQLRRYNKLKEKVERSKLALIQRRGFSAIA